MQTSHGGEGGELRGHHNGGFAAVARAPDGTLPERWLIAEWPDNEAEPVTYWLSSRSADTHPAEMIRYAKIRWWI